MPERNEEHAERLIGVEKLADWLEKRVWTGPDNLHDRVHVLEDRNGDRVHEITNLQADMAKVERVLGLDEYGGRNIITDLRDAVDTIQNLKGNLISTKDFQSLINQVESLKANMVSAKDFHTMQNDVETLKKRGQAQLSFWNFVQLGVVQTIIGFVMAIIMNRIVTP
jgi:phosphoglycerate-specific signal transduction histidine kinase